MPADKMEGVLDDGAPSWVARKLHFVPPPGLLLLAMVSFQAGAALAVSLFATLGSVRAAFLRLTFSAVIMLIATRCGGVSLKRLFADGRLLGWILALGCSVVVMNMAIYGALSRLPMGVGVTIEFLGPLCLAAANSRRLAHFLWIGLALAGVVLLSPLAQGVDASRLDPLGLGLAVLSGFGWAGFVLCSGKVGRLTPGHGGLALGLGVAAVLAVPAMLVLPNPPGTGFAALAVIGMALVAAFSTAIPFALEFEALRRMPPRTYGVLISLEPVLAFLAGALLLHQALSLREVSAVVCVTIAAVGTSLMREEET